MVLVSLLHPSFGIPSLRIPPTSLFGSHMVRRGRLPKDPPWCLFPLRNPLPPLPSLQFHRYQELHHLTGTRVEIPCKKKSTFRFYTRKRRR
jgi:hypothetical protein